MSKLLPYLRLLRAPNVFTAIADIAMGFLFVTHSLVPLGGFLSLVAASCGLYLAGMVLNDLFDVDVDRVERPNRPIPAGQISLEQAQVMGFGLLGFGIVCGVLSGFLFAGDQVDWFRSGVVAILLAGCVLLYDAGLKKTHVGPIAMGVCRTLNVFLGMSLYPALEQPVWFSFSVAQWSIAGGIGIFIAGVTWFARTEARDSSRVRLIFGLSIMAAGLGVMACVERFGKDTMFTNDIVWPALLTLLMVSVFRRGVFAIMNPQPEKVQATVKQAIFSLIVLDAAVCMAIRGPMAAIAVLALMVPMLVLGKWIYST